MKLSEFIVLNEAEKKRVVMNNAVALATRTSPGLIVFLFQINDYYVEAYCNPDDKSIEEYRVLPDTNSIRQLLPVLSESAFCTMSVTRRRWTSLGFIDMRNG